MSIIKYKKANRPVFEKNFLNPFDLLSNEMIYNKANSGNFKAPSVNIRESEDIFSIDVAAPGLEKKGFDIQLQDDQLVIAYQSEKKESEKSENLTLTREEFNFQSFTRTFTLPELVAEDKIKATYTDGILTVVIPRDTKKLEARKIQIS